MIRLSRKGFVKLSAVAFFLVWCHILLVVRTWQAPQTIAVDYRNYIRLELHALIQQALHITNTSTSLYKYSRHNPTRTDLQTFLGCLTHLASVSDGDIDARDTFSLYPNLNTDAACHHIISTPLTDSWDTSALCRHLIGMKILLVGSHMTYRLHNKLLDILPSGSQGSQFRCHGPAFCTWHEICSSSFPQADIPLSSSERRRMPPRVLSNSAILRFSMSSTLLSNVLDEENYQPYTSPLTSLREHSTTDWLEKARRSDMIILSKSPVPAPAWSYMSSNTSSLHRFNVRIPRPGSPEWNRMEPFISLLVPRGALLDSNVLLAAWRATMVKWLPELIETLSCLQTENVAMKERLFIWLGSSFVTGCAGEQEKHNNQTDTPWLQECDGCERCIFQNAQVYIQNLLLYQILPRLGILYIPAANPSPSQPMAPPSSSETLSKDRHRVNISVVENATKTHNAEDVFLRGLIAILRWKQSGSCDNTPNKTCQTPDAIGSTRDRGAA